MIQIAQKPPTQMLSSAQSFTFNTSLGRLMKLSIALVLDVQSSVIIAECRIACKDKKKASNKEPVDICTEYPNMLVKQGSMILPYLLEGFHMSSGR